MEDHGIREYLFEGVPVSIQYTAYGHNKQHTRQWEQVYNKHKGILDYTAGTAIRHSLVNEIKHTDIWHARSNKHLSSIQCD